MDVYSTDLVFALLVAFCIVYWWRRVVRLLVVVLVSFVLYGMLSAYQDARQVMSTGCGSGRPATSCRSAL
jgi:hypothetical protein